MLVTSPLFKSWHHRLHFSFACRRSQDLWSRWSSASLCLSAQEHDRQHGRRRLRRLPASGAAGKSRPAGAAACRFILQVMDFATLNSHKGMSPLAMTWKTWNPFTNRRYEALSYLPPLTPESIAKEVDFILAKGWVPCLEFDKAGEIHRSNSQMPGYYDGRYWTLWKLPMFGCAGAAEVLGELEECRREYPDAYIRLIAFDGSRQCQCMSFVVHKPGNAPAPAVAPAQA